MFISEENADRVKESVNDIQPPQRIYCEGGQTISSTASNVLKAKGIGSRSLSSRQTMHQVRDDEFIPVSNLYPYGGGSGHVHMLHPP